MNSVKCSFCFSEEVTVVSSHETKEAIDIRCMVCQAVSTVDVENFDVDLEDVTSE
jgi:hypothetical protein